MAHIFHSSVNSFFFFLFLDNDYCLFGTEIFKKIKVFKHELLFWSAVIWGESHLLFLSTILGLPLMAQWKGIHLNALDTGDSGLIPELERSSRVENDNPLQKFVRIILWTEEASGIQSMGSQTIRHNWVTEHTCTTLPPARSSHGNSEKWRKV